MRVRVGETSGDGRRAVSPTEHAAGSPPDSVAVVEFPQVASPATPTANTAGDLPAPSTSAAVPVVPPSVGARDSSAANSDCDPAPGQSRPRSPAPPQHDTTRSPALHSPATVDGAPRLPHSPPSPPRRPVDDEPYNSEDEHDAGVSRAAVADAAVQLAAAADASRLYGHTGPVAAPAPPVTAPNRDVAKPTSYGITSPSDSEHDQDRERERNRDREREREREREQERERERERDRERERERDRLGERAFADILRKKHLVIIPVRPDGNCLFRALAVQVYDSEDEHAVVRNEVLDFVEEEREWFSMFIAEDFTRYVRRKRRNGCHGNHLELQAAAELYGRPIEVYAYRSEPVNIIDCASRQRIRSLGGSFAEPEPFRLSFHRGSHYNCVLRIERARELQRAAAMGALRTRVRAPAEQKARRSMAAAAAAAARREMELAAAPFPQAAQGAQASSSRTVGDDGFDRLYTSDLADALATEEEMERAAMALSLAEARETAARGRGNGGGAGSSSSHPCAIDDYTPASVAALVDMGFSEERVLEAYLATDHGSIYDMMRYISRQVMLSKRSRTPFLPDGVVHHEIAAKPESTVVRGHGTGSAESTVGASDTASNSPVPCAAVVPDASVNTMIGGDIGPEGEPDCTRERHPSVAIADCTDSRADTHPDKLS